jgi:hypothetical protein
MLDAHGKRDFTCTVPGTRPVGDITDLHTGEGWLYLATVIDPFSGMVIGWAMGRTHARQPVALRPCGWPEPTATSPGIPLSSTRMSVTVENWAVVTAAEFSGRCNGLWFCRLVKTV